MSQQVETGAQTEHHRPDGAKRHIVTFVVSIILTVFAFIAVIVGGNATWVVPFIILIGIVQALFQLYVWMHMDQKGHELPALGMYTGVFVMLTVVIVFSYWLGGY